MRLNDIFVMVFVLFLLSAGVLVIESKVTRDLAVFYTLQRVK